MLGIHTEGTAEGWFGQGKASAIWSIAIIVILVLGICFGIWAATNAGGETTVSQPNVPVAPTAPTPMALTPTEPATTSATEPAVGSSGVIKTTAGKLASELAAEHFKYELGTVFQVSGVLKWQKERFPDLGGDVFFFLGPAVQTKDYPLGVIIKVNMREESELFKALATLEGDREVVVQGTYFTFDNSYRKGVILKNVSLVSVTPAK